MVVAWGNPAGGSTTVPAVTPGLAYAEVEASGRNTVARLGRAATSSSMGTGCGGAGTPTLGCPPPRVGQSATVSPSQTTPNVSGWVYASVPPLAPTPLGFGCTAQVDIPTMIQLIPVTTSAAGTWTSTIAVPLSQSLVGLQVALQAGVFGTAGPLGADISNGVIVTIGY